MRLLQVLGTTRVQGGLVVSPAQVAAPFPLSSVVGQHPQPGAGSEEAGRRALAIARAVAADAELIILISGGASALLAVPADGISLEDKRAATGVLLRAGADIYALNTVRKHLSAIKGGRLAAACRDAARRVRAVRRGRRRPQRHRLGTNRCGPVDLCGCPGRARSIRGIRRVSGLRRVAPPCRSARASNQNRRSQVTRAWRAPPRR